jgi:hypothetical protein
MGAQTRAAYQDSLEQIKDLEQGLLAESKKLYGLKYRTRIRMFNQVPVLSLDYSQGQVAPGLQPVQDDKLTVDHVTVKRSEGSRVTVSQQAGTITTGTPPKGKHAKEAKVVAADDAQLLALAQHLLNVGTDVSTRYPQVTVNLASPQMASQFAAAATVEVGDRIQIVQLPPWYPESTADQLVIGYTETLNSFAWTIAWNCQPASPWSIDIKSIRRW